MERREEIRDYISKYYLQRNQGKSRPDMNKDCLEKVDMNFIKWVFGYNRNQKPRILEKLKKLSKEKNIIILNSSSELNQFIEDLKVSTSNR